MEYLNIRSYNKPASAEGKVNQVNIAVSSSYFSSFKDTITLGKTDQQPYVSDEIEAIALRIHDVTKGKKSCEIIPTHKGILVVDTSDVQTPYTDITEYTTERVTKITLNEDEIMSLFNEMTTNLVTILNFFENLKTYSRISQDMRKLEKAEYNDLFNEFKFICAFTMLNMKATLPSRVVYFGAKQPTFETLALIPHLDIDLSSYTASQLMTTIKVTDNEYAVVTHMRVLNYQAYNSKLGRCGGFKVTPRIMMEAREILSGQTITPIVFNHVGAGSLLSSDEV